MLVRGVLLIFRAVERAAEKFLEENVTGQDAGEHRSVEETVQPLEEEGKDRQPVHHSAHLLLLRGRHLHGFRNGAHKLLNGFLRHVHDHQCLGRCQHQAAQERRAAPEAVSIGHFYVLPGIPKVQHPALENEDAAKEFRHPQENGRRRYKKLHARGRSQLPQQQAAHKGIREVRVSNAKTDTLAGYTNVFLILCYSDSVDEEIVVPMVERNGRWQMK